MCVSTKTAWFTVSCNANPSPITKYSTSKALTIKHHNSPLLVLQPIHCLLCFPWSLLSMSDHWICCDQNSTTHRFVFSIRSKPTNHAVIRWKQTVSFEYPATQFTFLLSFTYTHTHTILANGKWTKLFDLCNKLKLAIPVDHILNCCFHCSTDTPELQSTKARLRTVQQAVTPTKLFPAPAHSIKTHHCQGKVQSEHCTQQDQH